MVRIMPLNHQVKVQYFDVSTCYKQIMAFPHHENSFDPSNFDPVEAPTASNRHIPDNALPAPLSFHDEPGMPDQSYGNEDIPDDASSSSLSFHDEVDNPDFLSFRDEPDIPDQSYASKEDVQMYNETMRFWRNNNRKLPRVEKRKRFDAFMRGWLLQRRGEGGGGRTKRLNRLIAMLRDDQIQKRLDTSKEWTAYLASNESGPIKLYQKQLRQELKALPRQPGFKRSAKKTEKAVNPNHISDILQNGPRYVQQYAPMWYTLLRNVAVHQRAEWNSYHTQSLTQRADGDTEDGAKQIYGNPSKDRS